MLIFFHFYIININSNYYIIINLKKINSQHQIWGNRHGALITVKNKKIENHVNFN
jgi:hypothetical protein